MCFSLAIEASLTLVEALIFGIVFYIVYKSEETRKNANTSSQKNELLPLPTIKMVGLLGDSFTNFKNTV